MITLPIAELKPALVGLGKIISKHPTLPILGMVKVERTRDGWTMLSGTDLDAFVTARLEQPTNDEDPASLLVPFTDLQRIAKACDAKQTITLTPAKGDKVLVKCIGVDKNGKIKLSRKEALGLNLDGTPVA